MSSSRATLTILVLIVVVLGGCASPRDGIEVMTFNLRNSAAPPPHTWEERGSLMSELLRQEDPDLLGIQEGLWRQVQDVDRALPGHDWIGLGRRGGSRSEFCAVYYRRTRFDPIEFDHFWLSDTPNVVGSASWGNTVRRMVTWVLFHDRETGRRLYVVNTHLDHRSENSRRKSAALIRERVERFRRGVPIVLMGDFNAVAGASVPYETLVTGGPFVDTWDTAARTGELVSTFHGYRGPMPGGRRIDWILTKGRLECTSSRILTWSRDGLYPSDHFPVSASLRMSTSTTGSRAPQR